MVLVSGFIYFITSVFIQIIQINLIDKEIEYVKQ